MEMEEPLNESYNPFNSTLGQQLLYLNSKGGNKIK